MATTRTATTTWDGGLAQGTGTTSVGSGTFGPVSVSWARRTEDPEGATSPEELIAAAHASCYAMALSHELGQAGGTDIHLEISAAVSFDPTASPPITGRVDAHAVAHHQREVVVEAGVAHRGLHAALRGAARDHQRADAVGAQQQVEVGAGEGAGAELRDDEVAGCGCSSSMNPAPHLPSSVKFQMPSLDGS